MRTAFVIICFTLWAFCVADPVLQPVNDEIIEKAKSAIRLMNERAGEELYFLSNPQQDVLPLGLLVEKYGRGGVSSGTRYFMTLRTLVRHGAHMDTFFFRAILLSTPNGDDVERWSSLSDPQSDPSPHPSAVDAVIIAKANMALLALNAQEGITYTIMQPGQDIMGVLIDGELGQPQTHYWFSFHAWTRHYGTRPLITAHAHLFTNITSHDEVIEVESAPVMAPPHCPMPPAPDRHVQDTVETAAAFAVNEINRRLSPRHGDPSWSLELPSRDIYDVLMANYTHMGTAFGVRYYMSLQLGMLTSWQTLHQVWSFHRVDVWEHDGVFELMHDDSLPLDNPRVFATDPDAATRIASFAVSAMFSVSHRQLYLWDAPRDVLDYSHQRPASSPGVVYDMVLRLRDRPATSPVAASIEYHLVSVLDHTSEPQPSPPEMTDRIVPDPALYSVAQFAMFAIAARMGRPSFPFVLPLPYEALSSASVQASGSGRWYTVRSSFKLRLCQAGMPSPSQCATHAVVVAERQAGPMPWDPRELESDLIVQ